MDILSDKREELPLSDTANLIYQHLAQNPRRIAFAGIAGAGKSTMAELIAGTSDFLDYGDVTHAPVPIYNHADGIKDEVLTWVAVSRTRGLIPGERATFLSFCDSMGISPPIVEHYMWSILGPVWKAMNQLLDDAYTYLPPLEQWTMYEIGEGVELKVAFVDKYKSLFRTSLQHYGQAVKDIDADPTHWAQKTVNRSKNLKLCINADSRFDDEILLLNDTGWTSIYLYIDPETQRLRRPEMTEEQLAHVSENGIDPFVCDIRIDARQGIADVLSDILDAV